MIYKVYFARVVLVARYIYENIPSQNLFIFPDAVLLTSLYDNAFFLRSGYKLFIIPIFSFFTARLVLDANPFKIAAGLWYTGFHALDIVLKKCLQE